MSNVSFIANRSPISSQPSYRLSLASLAPVGCRMGPPAGMNDIEDRSDSCLLRELQGIVNFKDSGLLSCA